MKRENFLTLIPLGVALNVGLGTLVSLLKLPVYLDAVGTIIITLLLGWRSGAIVGGLSFLLMTITGIAPFNVYFSGTQIAISLFVYWCAAYGTLRRISGQIATGISLGIITAIVSAPVIVYLFGGVEVNGPGLLTAFLVKTGKTIYESVLLKGLSIEPLDKLVQLLISIYLLKSAPTSILQKYTNNILRRNDFLR